METIEFFMWPWQQHFRIHAQSYAERIFDSCNAKLAPQIFLLGILTEEREQRHPICLEPEECGYDVDMFSDVLTQASHFEAVDEGRFIMHSHPIAQENADQWRKKRALANAVHSVVDLYGRFNGLVSFCSSPVSVEGYMVCTVLQLNRDAFESHYSLANEVNDRFERIPRSLLREIVSEYLHQCSEALSKAEPGHGFGTFDREHEEILRIAGKRLTYTPASAGGGDQFGLFAACNTISSLRYEGAEGVGALVIARRGHPNIRTVLSFLSPVNVNDYRAVRKLLEISSGKYSLLCDSANIYGLGDVIGVYNHRYEDLFVIEFTQYYTWRLRHFDQEMMEVSYGQPHLPRPLMDKDKFWKDLGRIFPGISGKNIEELWRLINVAMEQHRGTMIVVQADAENEAIRLETQCIRIEPIELTSELMSLVTAIDGAVLIDEGNTCYAIGVILDGTAGKKGSLSRGARYNSAIRYVDRRKGCLAIVISADGTVDLIPDLMPQIPRSSLVGVVSKLRAMRDNEGTDVAAFNKAMNWLVDHRFYLLPQMCCEINLLRKEIEARFPSDNRVRILYNDFMPYEEMDESYLLEE